MLPTELARPYREALIRLQEAAPPLPVAMLHGVLGEELGVGWRDRFASFDDDPVAAASIGQVHRARWHDGTEAAVQRAFAEAFADDGDIVIAAVLHASPRVLVTARVDGHPPADVITGWIAATTSTSGPWRPSVGSPPHRSLHIIVSSRLAIRSRAPG